MLRKWMPVMAGVMTVSLVAAGCGSTKQAGEQGSSKDSSASGKVKVEFFQNKTEAKGTFDKLIKKIQ